MTLYQLYQALAAVVSVSKIVMCEVKYGLESQSNRALILNKRGCIDAGRNLQSLLKSTLHNANVQLYYLLLVTKVSAV